MMFRNTDEGEKNRQRFIAALRNPKTSGMTFEEMENLFNTAFYDDHGWPMDAIDGLRVGDFYSPDNRAGLLHDFDLDRLERHITTSRVLHVRRKAGSTSDEETHYDQETLNFAVEDLASLESIYYEETIQLLRTGGFSSIKLALDEAEVQCRSFQDMEQHLLALYL